MNHEINNVMKYFPDVKLSYENNIYKKVYNKFHYYSAIPYGTKYFVWFKTFYNKNNIYVMELNPRKKSILNIVKYSGCFSDKLCIKDGTLVYGTMIKQSGLSLFSIEDIFYAFGKNISNTNNLNKLTVINEILSNHLTQISFSKNNIIFGLPLMTDNSDHISNMIYNSPYKIWSIKYKNLYNNKVYYEKINTFNVYANFIIKADVRPDIYNLYILKHHKLVYYNKSIVSNYKNSVKMNCIFRNIKENNNLDLLEESDDEEEFEDISINKFMNNVEKLMKCKYHSKFKLWEPIDIIEGKVSSFNEVKQIENNL